MAGNIAEGCEPEGMKNGVKEKWNQSLNLWDAKRKPPPRANSPPTRSVIIYDESSSPSTDDYLIDANYPMKEKRRKRGGSHLKY
jgi:hypothetical protein